MSTTERAQRARIDRLLRKDGQALSKVSETARNDAEAGPYLILDLSTNTVAASGSSDLDALEADLRMVSA